MYVGMYAVDGSMDGPTCLNVDSIVITHTHTHIHTYIHTYTGQSRLNRSRGRRGLAGESEGRWLRGRGW